MFASLLLAASFQVGPFYTQREACDLRAVPPLAACEGETTDVLWPVFTGHRDWWRFCWFTHYQEDGARPEPRPYQFEVIPLWFNGRTREGEDYWGLFPLWGRHPHVLLMRDWEFALWPVWMRYRRPRAGRDGGIVSNNVLWPFVHWRNDGAWGVWPLYELNYQRESTHRAALWPIVTWAEYRADRDTAGEGTSWMVWPLYGRVRRERERLDLWLPPFFSYGETYPAYRTDDGGVERFTTCHLRCLWPIFEMEFDASRSRLSVFPLYENITVNRFSDGAADGGVTRFGWRLVELFRDGKGEIRESRVFPFWVKNDRYLRVWPFWERETGGHGQDVRAAAAAWPRHTRCLAPFPIRWVSAVDRNWAPYWTFYEAVEDPVRTRHALFWGLIRWETFKP